MAKKYNVYLTYIGEDGKAFNHVHEWQSIDTYIMTGNDGTRYMQLYRGKEFITFDVNRAIVRIVEQG